MPQGELLVYSDKVGKQSYLEYGKGYMSWFIAYNWTFFENTWANTDVYIDSKTLDPLNVKIRIYTNQDETQSINEQLIIDKGADTGVIAQQIEAIGLPETVTTRENGYKAVQYEKIIALLIEAVKELQEEVNQLKGK